MVVAIGWLYATPQLQGAGRRCGAATGLPLWAGGLVVAVVVLLNALSGGTRSITFVQAFQYWLKLTALLAPAASLSWLWLGDADTTGRPRLVRRRRVRSRWADPVDFAETTRSLMLPGRS